MSLYTCAEYHDIQWRCRCCDDGQELCCNREVRTGDLRSAARPSISVPLVVAAPAPTNQLLFLCSDLRLGVQGMTVSMEFEKVFKMHDRLFIGLAGLASDVQTL
jgi:hypothetical protein